ncbi:hypothetical protein [Cellulomonas sp. URHD0024]|uniref:hypothetical protein n=1 Tax=Cellulomonas sp. URHD0024 TaxID=1302620 RepID=UPI0004059882|nr:hypothetical protein [Cellulomonas sp. URHD0024]
MSTSRDERRPRWSFTTLIALVCAAVGLAVVWAILTAADEHDAASGALLGGGIALAFLGGAALRARRRPDTGGTTGRTMTGTADERDKAILRGALMWTGVTALVATTAAGVAITLGVDSVAVIASTQILLLAVLVGAFVVLSRRS